MFKLLLLSLSLLSFNSVACDYYVTHNKEGTDVFVGISGAPDDCGFVTSDRVLQDKRQYCLDHSDVTTLKPACEVIEEQYQAAEQEKKAAGAKKSWFNFWS